MTLTRDDVLHARGMEDNTTVAELEAKAAEKKTNKKGRTRSVLPFLFRCYAFLAAGSSFGLSLGTTRFSGVTRPSSTATMCSSRRTTMLE